jgi:hypothetical protein
MRAIRDRGVSVITESPPVSRDEYAGLTVSPTESRRTATLATSGLLLSGLLLETLYLALWVLSYPISQAPGWSVAYLTEHIELWEAFRPYLEAAQERWPSEMADSAALAGVLVAWVIAAFLVYGLALLCSRWLGGRTALSIVLIGSMVHQVTLVTMPSLFTTDLFSYATYGRLPAIYGLNPFTSYAAMIPNDLIASWIHPIWAYAPAVYGPLWIDLSMLIAQMSQSLTAADQVLIYRALANLAHVFNGLLVLAILRPAGPRAMLAGFVMYAWNPLATFEFAGNGHNDALMITFLLAGILAYRVLHPLSGIGLVTLSALIKPSAVLVLPLFGWLWVRQQRTWSARIGAAVSAVGLIVAVTALLYWPWYEGPDTFGPVILWSTVSPLYINYVPDFLSIQITKDLMFGGMPVDQALQQARDQVKLWTRLIFIAYFLLEVWFMRRWEDLAAASARVFIAFLVLVNTWVLAWYFTWSLGAICVARGGRVLNFAVIGMTLAAMTVTYYHHFLQQFMPDEYYALYLAPLALELVAGAIQLLMRLASPRGLRVPVPQTPGSPFR